MMHEDNKRGGSLPFASPARLSGLPPEAPLLVAFSGGADSRLLLELTHEWAGIVGAPVTAVHLNHGIRGAEADRDEQFCREVCAALGIELVCEHVDVPTLAAESKRSIEAEARLARYDLFARVMQERRIPLLLTAHHADDQVETLLLHLLRGSGVRGLGGIPPVRKVPGGLLLRPLLEATRQDILCECQRRGLNFVTDCTNEEDDCTRNRLRHHVLPLLEELTDRGVPQRAATRLCEAAREDDAFLTAEADRHYDAVDDRGDGRLSLPALCALPPPLAKRCILRGYAQAAGTGEDGERSLSATHLRALLFLTATGRESSSVSLPGGWRGVISDGRLMFVPSEPAPVPRDETVDGLRLHPGDNLWCAGGYRFTITLESIQAPTEPTVGTDVLASAVFPATLPEPLTLRRRCSRDSILSHGMTKKLKKLLCDKHIPQSLRDAIPAVCLPSGDILWFPTVAFCDGWKPPREGRCLRLTLRIQ